MTRPDANILKHAIQLSKLKYENIPHKRGNKPRVWYLEEQETLWFFTKDILRAIYKRFKAIKWAKQRKTLRKDLKRLGKHINKPRTVKVGKTKLIIGAYIMVASTFFLPTRGVIYADPSPVGMITFNNKTAIADTKLQPQAEVAEIYVAPSLPTGNCSTWLAQAGIPVTYGVMELINGESGCNPYSVNKSSGACGISQNINGCSTYDPVAQLIWMKNYIAGRYGSWDNAYNIWLSRSPHWY